MVGRQVGPPAAWVTRPLLLEVQAPPVEGPAPRRLPSLPSSRSQNPLHAEGLLVRKPASASASSELGLSSGIYLLVCETQGLHQISRGSLWLFSASEKSLISSVSFRNRPGRCPSEGGCEDS